MVRKVNIYLPYISLDKSVYIWLANSSSIGTTSNKIHDLQEGQNGHSVWILAVKQDTSIM